MRRGMGDGGVISEVRGGGGGGVGSGEGVGGGDEDEDEDGDEQEGAGQGLGVAVQANLQDQDRQCRTTIPPLPSRQSRTGHESSRNPRGYPWHHGTGVCKYGYTIHW